MLTSDASADEILSKTCCVCETTFQTTIDTPVSVCDNCTRLCARRASAYIEEKLPENTDSRISLSIDEYLQVVGCETFLDREVLIDETVNCFACPVNYMSEQLESCEWTGERENLYDHILECHEHLMTKLPNRHSAFDLTNGLDTVRQMNHNVIQDPTIVCFSFMEKQFVTILLKHIENKFYLLVLTNRGDEIGPKYRQEVTIFDEHKNNFVTVNVNCLHSLDDMDELVSDPANMIELDFSRWSQSLIQLKNPINATMRLIEIKDDAVEEEIEDESEEIEEEEIEVESDTEEMEEEGLPAMTDPILESLECPICNEYMVPPIYTCEIGHSICALCKSKVTICPCCKGPISTGRNFTLEGLTRSVNYPCTNRSSGCSLILNSSRIRAHEETCKFAPKKCLDDDCAWSGTRSQLLRHLRTAHSSQIMELFEMTQFCIGEPLPLATPYYRKYKTFLFFQEDKIFKLHVKCEQSRLIVNLSCSGNEHSKYKYIFELVTNALPDGPQLRLPGVCESFASDVIHNYRNQLSISLDALLTFFVDENNFITFIVTLEN